MQQHDKHTHLQAGFFRRTRHEEIKQKREELQNLADNGVEPDKGEGGDGTNLQM